MPRPLPIDGFLITMLTAVGLSFLAPTLGASHGPLHLEVLTQLGIALVFLLHGIALSTDNLKAGARNWRLHVFVQSCTFILFPLLGFAAVKLVGTHLPADLMLGVFFLCSLCSTISSSVAMTVLARGNVPGAIFDATLSSILGMVATPLLISLVATTGSGQLPLGKAIADIALQLLLPFAIGQALRPALGGWMTRHKENINLVDRGVIILIVYGSFCDSAASHVWTGFGWQTLLAALGLVAALLGVVLVTTTWTARRLRFSREDEITAVFCGSKKSLATGIPIAQLLFGGHPSVGMIVLPLMAYHQLQLFVCAIIARRYARQARLRVAPPVEQSFASPA
jgi:solute carrier family 10 (sodium/bile acid cotransporter), member 7